MPSFWSHFRTYSSSLAIAWTGPRKMPRGRKEARTLCTHMLTLVPLVHSGSGSCYLKLARFFCDIRRWLKVCNKDAPLSSCGWRFSAFLFLKSSHITVVNAFVAIFVPFCSAFTRGHLLRLLALIPMVSMESLPHLYRDLTLTDRQSNVCLIHSLTLAHLRCTFASLFSYESWVVCGMLEELL